MKSISLIIVSIISLIGCQNTDKKTDKPEILAQKEKQQTEPTKKVIASQLEDISVTVDANRISYNNINFTDTKARMLSIMGKPDSIVEPKYECGPFSEAWENMKFYQYFYGNMNFIVYNEKAEIQDLYFASNEQLKIQNIELDGSMSFDQVAKLLGIDLSKGQYNKNRIIIFHEVEIDEHYFLKFKDNKLHSFDRLEPC